MVKVATVLTGTFSTVNDSCVSCTRDCSKAGLTMFSAVAFFGTFVAWRAAVAVLLRVFMTSHAGGIDSATSYGNVLIVVGACLHMFAASMLQHGSI